LIRSFSDRLPSSQFITKSVRLIRTKENKYYIAFPLEVKLVPHSSSIVPDSKVRSKPIIAKAPSLPSKPIIAKTPSLPSKPIIAKAPLLPSKPIIAKAPSLPSKPIISKAPLLPSKPIIAKAPLLPSKPIIAKAPLLPIIAKAPLLPIIAKAPSLLSKPIIAKAPLKPIVLANKIPSKPIIKSLPSKPIIAKAPSLSSVNKSSGSNLIDHNKRKEFNQPTRTEKVLKGNAVALDPGVRIFQTTYDTEGNSYLIGENGAKKLDSLAGIARRMREGIYRYYKDGKSFSKKYRKARNSKEKKGLLKAANCIEQRIKNMISDIHRKTAKFLCEKYDTIIIPEFASQDMVRDVKRKIGKSTARQLLKK
jgi:hypothetical protein